MRADWVEEFAARKYLEAVGFIREYTDVVHGGYDPTAEAAEVQEELRQYMEDRDLFKSKAGQKEWKDRAQALESRLATLESAEAVPPRVERVYGEKTNKAAWDATSDPLEHRRMLMDVGAVVRLSVGAHGDVSGLDESRLTFSIGNHVDPEEDAKDEAAFQAAP